MVQPGMVCGETSRCLWIHDANLLATGRQAAALGTPDRFICQERVDERPDWRMIEV